MSHREPYEPLDRYTDRESTFAHEVVNRLHGGNESAIGRWTGENHRNSRALGPVEVAAEEGVDPDPLDEEAVETVAEAIRAGFEDWKDTAAEEDLERLTPNPSGFVFGGGRQ